MSVVPLIVATRSSGPPASGKIIKEMPGSAASGTLYITWVPCGARDVKTALSVRETTGISIYLTGAFLNTEVWVFQNIVGFHFSNRSISHFWIEVILMKVICQNPHISCFEFKLHCTHLTCLALKPSFSQLSPSYIYRWPSINLDTSESRLEITGKLWNVLLGTDGEDRLDRSCEKWRSITQVLFIPTYALVFKLH